MFIVRIEIRLNFLFLNPILLLSIDNIMSVLNRFFKLFIISFSLEQQLFKILQGILLVYWIVQFRYFFFLAFLLELDHEGLEFAFVAVISWWWRRHLLHELRSSNSLKITATSTISILRSLICYSLKMWRHSIFISTTTLTNLFINHFSSYCIRFLEMISTFGISINNRCKLTS